MAIKISGSTIIDDSRVLVNTGNVGVGTTNPDSSVDPGNTNIVHAGIVTANFLYGDGSNLTNVPISGIATDSQTLDGLDSTQFLRSDVADTKVGVTTFSDAADFNGNIDVDGHTELDNVNVSGVSTFAGAIDANGDLDVDGHTELDNVNVSGVSTFSNDVSIADKITHQGDTNTAIRFPANDTFTVETAGSERLRVTSDGSVGIGTDNPTGAADPNNTTILNAGIVTANFYYGDGTSVTNVDATRLDGQLSSYYLNTTTSFSGDVTGNYNTIVVTNDSHTHDTRYFTETESDNRFLRKDVADTKVGVTTFEDDVTVTGFVTATTYYGDGSNLTGVQAGKWSDAGVGIITTSSIGVNTTTVVGTANSEGAIQAVGNIALIDGAILTDQNIDNNIYIPSGKNGLLIGPSTVGAGVTIDVAPGSTLVVV